MSTRVKSYVELLHPCGINILVVVSDIREFCLDYKLPTTLNIRTRNNNKQVNNLDRSVVTGKSQTSAYRIDRAIARSIRQGLSLRFSRNDLTLGY